MSNLLCIGSVLWDVIGLSPKAMAHGNDLPGRITRQPGGVALNVAMALRQFGLAPALLSAVGQDAEGEALIKTCQALDLNTGFVFRSSDLRTDLYMAIEDPNGLIAAIADASSLEAAGADILAPLQDGRLGSAAAPYDGIIVLDGNLTADLMDEIARSPLLVSADLRVAPASPGKALRLRPFLNHRSATLYVNLEEANLLSEGHHEAAADAAQALRAAGARRVLVTHGPHDACFADAEGLFTETPPRVTPRRITGAGDMVIAAHIAAELDAADRQEALSRALCAAATHVAGGTP
ncbi:kinase [Roseovarius faecimaris]|uniref:Kinase n=1 Tax=Roseovarius faecimaris TaxID=2494550 RepID=A0A6I6J0V3_9RHOB|nr:PfkB family carbohydrate kinase [Roseovarius faecimaris]QGX98418.1 kinase [Roseovarius faecimaris]